MPVVPSNPATFTLDHIIPVVPTFAIPAGVWVSGVWDLVGTYTLTQNENINVVTTSGNVSLGVVNTPGGPNIARSVAASANQMIDINAAAGGNMNGAPALTGLGVADTVDVSLFTLTLTGAGDGGGNTVGEIIHFSPHFSDAANAQRSIVRHG